MEKTSLSRPVSYVEFWDGEVEGEHSSGEERSTTPSGCRSEVDCGVRAADGMITDRTLRRTIDEAMQLLGSMAHDAD